MATQWVKTGDMLIPKVKGSGNVDKHPGFEFQNGGEVVTHFLQNVQNFMNNTKVPEVEEVLHRGMPLNYYTLEDVARHSDITSCWIVRLDKVYDVTEFIAEHPGGEEIILEHAGFDATVPFDSKGHSAEAYEMMEKYCIGELVESDRRFKKKLEDKNGHGDSKKT